MKTTFLHPHGGILTIALWYLFLRVSHAAPLASNDTTHTNNTTNPRQGPSFSWDSITPTLNLVYHPCYTNFSCARLLVPLDYLSPSVGNASIAIIKLASDPSFPEYKEKWGGPILINPGGPGGSGVDTVLQAGNLIQGVVGKQFSIIGFDPRGTGHTQPLVSCFDSDLDRTLWTVKGGNRQLGSGGGEEIGEAYVRGKIFGKLCTEGKRGVMGKYVGTTSVARDMLAINEASWDLAELTIGKKRQRKNLQYWGFSYGSALGLTYARLFPDKIERMVIDGIVNVNDFFALRAGSLLIDSENVMQLFFTFCLEAGPLRCAFYTGVTPDDIRARLTALLAALREQPLALNIPAGQSSQPDMFTYSDLSYIIFTSLYSPLTSFPPLAELLVKLEGFLKIGYVPVEILETGYLPNATELHPAVMCPANKNDPGHFIRSAEATPAILCADGPTAFNNMTLSSFRLMYEQLQSQSPTMGGIRASSIAPCLGWKAQSVERPPVFTPPSFSNSAKWTSTPLLIVGNTADPVTPLANAYAMAKMFPKGGAVVAVQEGEGHCSIAQPSACIMGIIGKYFQTGQVPTGNMTYCKREFKPFFDVGPKVNLKRDGARDEAFQSMKKIAQIVHRENMPVGLQF